jgi:hypothetical protein
MARGTALVLTRSWGPFVDYCTPAWFPWVAEERLHAMDLLSAQVVCRPGLLLGCRAEDILGKFSRYVSNFNCFLL